MVWSVATGEPYRLIENGEVDAAVSAALPEADDIVLGRPPELAEFAALVEDHDLWRHSDPRSAQLAALLGLVGHERFISRFASDPRVHFTEGELLLMEVEARRRQDYIERRVAQAEQVVIGGRRWAVCFAEQYQSDLADALMKGLGVEATAIVNAARATVSLRARDLDVSLIARRFGGGGHARAAAFTAAGKPLEEGLLDFKRTLVEAACPALVPRPHRLLKRNISVPARRPLALLAQGDAQRLDQRRARMRGLDHVIDIAALRRHQGVGELLDVVGDQLSAPRGRVTR